MAALARARKALAAGLGLVATLLAAGLIPSPWNIYAGAVLAAATTAGVYRLPNAPAAFPDVPGPSGGVGGH